MVYQEFRDPMAFREFLERQGRKDHREEQKGRLVTRDREELWVQRERKEKKGHVG